MIIYELFCVNYALIKTKQNLHLVTLLISNHVGILHCFLIAFSLIFTLSHLKTYYGMKGSLCLHDHMRNESRKQNIIGITINSLIQVE